MYEKPYIDVEEFSVIDYISSCSVITTVSMGTGCGEPSDENSDMFVLYYMYPEVFTEVCELDFDDFDYMSYCYHTPTGATAIFTS